MEYVKNKTLYLEIIKCRDASLTASPELIQMFTKISEKYSRNFQYKYESDRDDCIEGGVIDAWQYWTRFDPSISTNAFAYITQVIKNGQMKQFRKLVPPETRGCTHVSLSHGKIYSL